MTRVYAVSDVHGYRDVLVRALAEEGLTDADGRWAGRDARLWFLGDYLDRGPDGVGVIDLVRRLVDESGGAVAALLGNHEVLALGMRRFGATTIPPPGEPGRSFARSWARNGGLDRDQARLTDEHVAWLGALPMAAHDAGALLVHSDTLAYLGWGRTLEDLNAAGRDRLASDDLVVWWETWRDLTSRAAFRGEHGPRAARELLDHLGGDRVVHGHSIVAEMLGTAYTDVTEPHSYADGRALAIDGGVYEGGPCLVARLA
ncbi:metallophosphoesterase family protein [Isoptericola sp. QY 916]|uniref:metallophosphoesterase family protein n=1 Tax=Isoptericola sp. QY 916 TaxID=2782570 RepID=UPI003D2FCB01|nr:serine/threonine protein phosphatase [Isoptericola sp. QY 916]